jgi:Zn-dependent protease
MLASTWLSRYTHYDKLKGSIARCCSCGCIMQAFNLLPVGALDGGRLMESAYGRPALNVTSFLTYAGLLLGFVGGSMGPLFAFFVLLWQRNPTKYLQDTVRNPEILLAMAFF